ncbi:MAG: hypothetical protein U0V73_02070 [Acidimicrobiia bacterium]
MSQVPESTLETIVRQARARTSREPVPEPSARDRDLLAQLAEHVTDEEGLLADYAHLAEDAPDEYVRYVAGMILSDERRHHQALLEVVNQLRTGAEWREVGPRVPWLTQPTEGKELRQTARRLLAEERKDARKLRRFRRRLGPLRRDSLLGVVVDTLILDTKKHIRMLRFLERTTHSRAR